MSDLTKCAHACTDIHVRHQGVVSVGVSSSVCEVEDEDHFTVIERLVEEQFSVTKRILELVRS